MTDNIEAPSLYLPIITPPNLSTFRSYRPSIRPYRPTYTPERLTFTVKRVTIHPIRWPINPIRRWLHPISWPIGCNHRPFSPIAAYLDSVWDSLGSIGAWYESKHAPFRALGQSIDLKAHWCALFATSILQKWNLLFIFNNLYLFYNL